MNLEDEMIPTIKCDPPRAETDEAYSTAGRAAADYLWSLKFARTAMDPGRMAFFVVPVPVSQELMQVARASFSDRWAVLAHGGN